MLIHNLFGYSFVGLSPRKILMVRGDTNQAVRTVFNFPCFSCAPWQKQVVRGDTNHGTTA